MKCKLHPNFTDISGPVGGLSFVSHPDGKIVRGVPSSRPDPSSAQSGVRAAYNTLVSLWRTLPQDIKEWWGSQAQQFHYSGFNLWVRFNISHIRSEDPIDFTPDFSSVSTPDHFSFLQDPSSDQYYMTFDSDPDPPYDSFYSAFRYAGSNKFSCQTTNPITYSTFQRVRDLQDIFCMYNWDFDSVSPSDNQGSGPDLSLQAGSVGFDETPNGLPALDTIGTSSWWRSASDPTYAPSWEKSFMMGFWCNLRSVIGPFTYGVVFEWEPGVEMVLHKGIRRLDVLLHHDGVTTRSRRPDFDYNFWHHVMLFHSEPVNKLWVFFNFEIFETFDTTGWTDDDFPGPVNVFSAPGETEYCDGLFADPFLYLDNSLPSFPFWHYSGKPEETRYIPLSPLTPPQESTAHVCRRDGETFDLSEGLFYTSPFQY